MPGEPHDLYRHEVIKHVEPGHTWLPYGTAEDAETEWWRDAALGARIAARGRLLLARELGHGGEGGGAEAAGLPDDALPCAIAGVAVRLYESGLVGYGLALGGKLETGLREAVRQAAADRRRPPAFDPARGAMVVSILHHPEPLGAAPMALGTPPIFIEVIARMPLVTVVGPV